MLLDCSRQLVAQVSHPTCRDNLSEHAPTAAKSREASCPSSAACTQACPGGMFTAAGLMLHDSTHVESCQHDLYQACLKL